MWFRNGLKKYRGCVYSVKRYASNSQYWSSASYLHHPGEAPLQYSNLGTVLADSAHAHPGVTALKSAHEQVSYTYEELLTKADALGCALRERGLERGDRLGVWSHNCSDWVLAIVAAARVGIIPVAINPAYTKHEVSYCLKKTGVKALIIGDRAGKTDYYGAIAELVPKLGSSKTGCIGSAELPDLTTLIVAGKDALPGTVTCGTLVSEGEQKAKNDADRLCESIQPEEGSIIHFTSGTTGNPKAALDSHFGVVNQAYLVGKRLLLHEQHNTVCLQCPIFHALGSVITVLSALRHGATLVVASPLYNVHETAKAITTEKCTVVTGTPTMFVDLVAESRRAGGQATPRSLRVALTAGAPCSPSHFTDIQNYLNVESVKSLYGMTELTASVFMSVPGESVEHTTTTVGRLQEHTEVKVVDASGRMVPFGTRGELLVRGYSNMLRYWGEPDKTRETIIDGGWLRTGDEFILSPDGYGRIVGRQKEIIVRGGENIAPKEIEDHLNTHPHILESQVIGVPDARLGEELMAVVRLRGATPVSAAELREHLAPRLAAYKVPRLLRIVDDFPKTASGKIQKYKLKEMVESGEL